MIVRVAENSFDHFRGNFQTGQFVRVIAVTGQVFRIKLRPDVKPGDLVRILSELLQRFVEQRCPDTQHPAKRLRQRGLAPYVFVGLCMAALYAS